VEDLLSEEALDDDMETWVLWNTIPTVRFVELVSESQSRLQQIKDEASGVA
jgi:hypothetical protein